MADESLVRRSLGAAVPRAAGRPAEAAGRTESATGPGDWGWLPALAAVAAGGLLLVAIADTGARSGAPWAEPVFWLGLTLAFGVFAARLAGTAAGRDERLGLAIVLGLGLYLVKVLHSPLAFTFHDEFLHWRTANDILASGHLYEENPLLPVSALYPGLELVTSALVGLGGLTIFQAGIVLVGAGRLVLVAALFLLGEDVARSPRIAGQAALLYMANPNFVFFDAQFAYESLALPLAVLTLLAARRWARASSGGGWAWGIAFVCGLGATTITHHLTAYALAGMLLLWCLASLVLSRSASRETLVSATATGLAVSTSLAWLVAAGPDTFGYLAPVLGGGLADLAGWLAGRVELRRLFSDFAGQRSALWEQLVGYAAVALILLGLPFGLRRIWRKYRGEAMTLALGVVVLGYPASLALRLTERGAETSNRSSEFLFVGIAFVLALAVAESWLPPGRMAGRWGWVAQGVAGVWATVLFMGGLIVGWGPVARLPGPYLVGADTRSVDPQSVAVAHAMRRLVGPGNRVAADRTNALLLGSYGEQRPVSAFVDWVGIAPLYLSPELGPEERQILRRGSIRYVLVDRRLSSGLPAVGVYVELGEPNAYRHTAPVPPAALTKLEGVAGTARILDGGDVVVYDVRGLLYGP